jgi:hypothetical protein
MALDRPAECSTFVLMESRDTGRGAEPWLDGAYALRQRLSRGHQVDAALRVPQSAQGSFRSKTHRLLCRDAHGRGEHVAPSSFVWC